MSRKLKIYIILIFVIIIGSSVIGLLAPILMTNQSFLEKIASWVLPKPKTVENPKAGIAVIKSTQQTNKTCSINGHLFYEMEMMVEVSEKENEETWPAVMREFVPVEYISQLQSGRKLQILYNAKDSNQVVIPDGNFIIGS